MFKFGDRVKESSTTTGTGVLTLVGAASGFNAFASALSDQDRCFYLIQGQTTTEWESGIGKYTSAGTTLTREQVISSSNSNALVTLSAGTKDVVITPPTVTFGHTGAEFFGDGSNGKVTISSGVTTLADDANYEDLTISGTGQLVTAGWQVRVQGVLDLSNAPAGAIIHAVPVAGATLEGGAGGATGAAGVAGSWVQGNSMVGGVTGAGIVGGPGGTGSTTTGGQGGIGIAGRAGGSSGASGAGGSGAGGVQAGGALRPGLSTSGLANGSPRIATNTLTRSGGLINFVGGSSGAGGGAGGGSGAAAGGGGGAGGSGANVLAIYARFIKRGGSTAAGAIATNGGKGGAGGSASTLTCGGGGGGAGGGGGWIYLVYQALMGTTATNALECSGADGGVGGAGNTTGNGGNGGDGGAGGRMTQINIGGGAAVVSGGSTGGTLGTTGGVASGTTGGTAGVGTVFRANL